MEKLNKVRGLYLIFPIIIYITLFYFVRENGLINDELSLYNYLSDIKLEELFKIQWTDTFKFVKNDSLNDTQYFRPILNYIYVFGFWIYDLLTLTPLILNWLSIFILGYLVNRAIISFNSSINSRVYTIFYLLMPFNFEAALFFPNISDLLVQIIVFSSLILLKSKLDIKIKIITYYFLVLVGLLIKEASIILFLLPLSVLIIQGAFEKRILHKFLLYKSKFIINYLLVFIIAFISYYSFRILLIETDASNYDLIVFSINTLKGAFNFIFFSQDINIVFIEMIFFIYFIYLIVKNRIFQYIIYSFLISIPVTILIPDDRFFHISYFTLLMCLLVYNNKKILRVYLLIALIVLSYKVYSTYEAMNFRITAKEKFENINLADNQICLSLLPYRYGNEAEVFYNGINFYLMNEKVVPLLLKQSMIYKSFDVQIVYKEKRTIIHTNSKIIIPHLNGNQLNYKGLHIKIIDNNKLEIDNPKKNNYIIFNSFTN